MQNREENRFNYTPAGWPKVFIGSLASLLIVLCFFIPLSFAWRFVFISSLLLISWQSLKRLYHHAPQAVLFKHQQWYWIFDHDKAPVLVELKAYSQPLQPWLILVFQTRQFPYRQRLYLSQALIGEQHFRAICRYLLHDFKVRRH